MRARSLLWFSIAVLTSFPAWTQVHERDPLNEKEVDQLREAAIEPEKRLKLYVEFTRARITAIDQLRSDTKLTSRDRGERMHDLLEDIASLIDEIDDNVENYDERSADLRKPLKDVVQLDSELQLKLREWKAAADDPKNASASDYNFALQDANDSVNSSAESTRKVLEEQNVKFANAKKKK